MWDWLVHSPAGLALRIAIGVIVFSLFALTDLRKRGKDATRWKEYRFLLLCVLCAIAYGIVNDQITSTISWEYFYYGKGLDEILGPTVPPDMVKLHLLSIKVAAQATWTAGLIVGVVLLIANNKSASLPQLSYPRLGRKLVEVFAITAVCAAVAGIAGFSGALVRFNDDFSQMVAHNEWQPYRFMCVYGIHLGGYIGALIGLAVATTRIRRERKKL